MQMKLFSILYLVIKIVILIAIKTEELESFTEYGCPFPQRVTQSPHRINTLYPKETKPSKASEVNSAQGLTRGIRSQVSSAVLQTLVCTEGAERQALGQGDRQQRPTAPSGRATGIRKRRKILKVVVSREGNVLEELTKLATTAGG